MTIYAIDGTVNLNAANAIYKSTDGGYNWTGLPAIAGASAVAVNNIAVAPDNPCVVAVTNRGAGVDQAWVSNDGGFTWAQLPAPNGAAAAMGFLDIKVGPARGGTIYGRDYLAALADESVTVALGSLQILGETATWTNIAAPGAVADFTSCEMSPNFVVDRIVFAVGATVAAGAGSQFYSYNVQNYSSAPPALIHPAVVLNAVTEDIGAVANAILAGDIAVPSNYDITPGFERVYVSTASAVVANDGVWRCDSVLPPAELGMAGTGIRSIDYYGDVTAGQLIAGEYATTMVWYTTTPTSASPTWGFSSPSPVGVWLTVVAINPTDMHTCYAGTSGTGSCFSISTDNAHSFFQP